MRKFSLTIFALALGVAFSSTASAQSKSAITASAGYVAGENTSDGSGSWSGLASSAQTATITYTHNLSSGGNTSNGGGNEFKFVNASGQFAPKIFTGDHASYNSDSGSAAVYVDGHSFFANTADPSATAYYQASWTATTQTNGDGVAGTGTYDPWVVKYSDLVNLGVSVGGTASLYYQTGLGGGYSSSSGFDLTPGGAGTWDFNASAGVGGQTLDFFNISEDSKAGLNVTFTHYTNFSIYLLGSNAHLNSANPGDRRSAGTLITSGLQLGNILAADLNPDGSLSNNLDFGIYYDNVTLPAGYDPNGTVVSWHTDTGVTVQSVPEPASLSFIGLGLLGLLRKKKTKTA